MDAANPRESEASGLREVDNTVYRRDSFVEFDFPFYSRNIRPHEPLRDVEKKKSTTPPTIGTHLNIPLGTIVAGSTIYNNKTISISTSGTVGSAVETVSNGSLFDYGSRTVSTFPSSDGNYVQIAFPSSSDLELSSDFSIDFFLKKNSSASSSSQGAALVTYLYNTSDLPRGFVYWWDAGSPGIYIHDSARASYAGNGSISQGTWAHIAISRVGNTLRHFVNGTQIYTSNVSGKTLLSGTQSWLRLGGGFGRGGHDFYGSMWNFRMSTGSSLFPDSSTFSVPAYVRVGLPVTNGLLVYYSFDSVVGNTINDESGNGITLTKSNASTTNIGHKGYALDFSNDSSPYPSSKSKYATLSSNPVTSFPRTVSFWSKRGTGTIGSFNGNNASNEPFIISLGTNDLAISRAGGSFNIALAHGITDTNFHHFALILASSTSSSLYVDGALKSTSNATYNIGAGGNYADLGASYDSNYSSPSRSGTSGSDAAIDDFAVYNRVLTEAEISNLANY